MKAEFEVSSLTLIYLTWFELTWFDLFDLTQCCSVPDFDLNFPWLELIDFILFPLALSQRGRSNLTRRGLSCLWIYDMGWLDLAGPAVAWLNLIWLKLIEDHLTGLDNTGTFQAPVTEPRGNMDIFTEQMLFTGMTTEEQMAGLHLCPSAWIHTHTHTHTHMYKCICESASLRQYRPQHRAVCLFAWASGRDWRWTKIIKARVDEMSRDVDTWKR